MSLRQLKRRLAALTVTPARVERWQPQATTSGQSRARLTRLLLTATLRVHLKREPRDEEVLTALSAAGGEARVLVALVPGAASFAARDMKARGEAERAQRMREISRRFEARVPDQLTQAVAP
jgi:hypothetical protein